MRQPTRAQDRGGRGVRERWCVHEAARLVGGGVLLGGLLSWFGAGLIRDFLFAVRPFDTATISSVVAALLVLALAVTLKPALRAAKRTARAKSADSTARNGHDRCNG